MEKNKINFKKNLYDIITVIFIMLLFITIVGQFAFTVGDSMNNTLENGDLLITEKITKNFKDNNYERFDIIIFNQSIEKDNNWVQRNIGLSNNKMYIKRIIGLPGEKIKINDGKIYINGEELEENYGKEIMEDGGIAAIEFKLGDDEYFVLGDNRNNSLDSRYIGPVPKYKIISHAIFDVYKFKKI